MTNDMRIEIAQAALIAAKEAMGYGLTCWHGEADIYSAIYDALAPGCAECDDEYVNSIIL